MYDASGINANDAPVFNVINVVICRESVKCVNFRGGVENKKKKYNCKKNCSNIWSFQKKTVPLRPNFICASTRDARLHKECKRKRVKNFR